MNSESPRAFSMISMHRECTTGGIGRTAASRRLDTSEKTSHRSHLACARHRSFQDEWSVRPNLSFAIATFPGKRSDLSRLLGRMADCCLSRWDWAWPETYVRKVWWSKWTVVEGPHRSRQKPSENHQNGGWCTIFRSSPLHMLIYHSRPDHLWPFSAKLKIFRKGWLKRRSSKSWRPLNNDQ